MIIARNFGNAGVGVDSLWAYHTLNVFHLIVERLRACRRLMLREKTLVTARLDWRCWADAVWGRTQAFAWRNHGKVRRHHAAFAPLVLIDAKATIMEIATAKVFTGNRGDW
jgi:hypothetical protein